tara:strand:+ start:2129 stop:3307 length:1179 start_codon:yes stop_codon:yes gene_type:complete
MKYDISILGLGYIGLPFVLLLNKKGFNINAVDINKKRIKELVNGKFRSEENEINKIYKSIKKKSVNFSTILSNSKFYILCLPTPLKKNLECDLSYLINAIKQISKVIKINDTIIVESTVPIGTTTYLSLLLKKLRPDLKNNFNICFSPEKAIPGNTLYEMKNNQRIIGSNKKTFNLVKKIYQKISKQKIRNCKIEEAEASKLIENSYRDNQLAFSNFVDTQLKEIKLDSKKILEICNRHPRVDFLNPSIGVGGHCIPVDPYFLNFKKNKHNMILISRKINNIKTLNIATKLKKILKERKREKVCLWGLGYKAGSSDLRESPSIKIIKLLKNFQFFISDPYFDLIKQKNCNLKNFIAPKIAKKKCQLHIILNLEKSFLKKNFANKKYILAEEL